MPQVWNPPRWLLFLLGLLMLGAYSVCTSTTTRSWAGLIRQGDAESAVPAAAHSWETDHLLMVLFWLAGLPGALTLLLLLME